MAPIRGSSRRSLSTTLASEVRKRCFESRLSDEKRNDRFVKTGSGQTFAKETLQKRRCVAAGPGAKGGAWIPGRIGVTEHWAAFMNKDLSSGLGVVNVDTPTFLAVRKPPVSFRFFCCFLVCVCPEPALAHHHVKTLKLKTVALFEPFIYKNDLFTKTGSGQT
eukprot:COSAG06_NODE_4679_length_4042_cov_4.646704_1_plen_163_part_00